MSILWWSFTVWGSKGSTLYVSQHPSKVDHICKQRQMDLVNCRMKWGNVFECLGIGCRTIWAPWLYWLVKSHRSSNLGYSSKWPETAWSCRPFSSEEWAKVLWLCWMALHRRHVNQLFGSFTSPLLQDNHLERLADKDHSGEKKIQQQIQGLGCQTCGYPYIILLLF